MRLTQDKGQEDEPDQPGDEYPPFPTLAEDDLASARLRCGIGWRILFRRSWFVRRLAGLFCFLSHKLPTERCGRSEEHTSELQSLMRSSYAVFCLKTNIYDTLEFVG